MLESGSYRTPVDEDLILKVCLDVLISNLIFDQSDDAMPPISSQYSIFLLKVKLQP